MATFRPTKSQECELNFDDKFIYHIPLHEDTINKIASVSEKQVRNLRAINTEDEDALDKAYNMSLDAIDEILGEGAGADIMTLYDKPSVFNVGEVILYISNEVKEQYEQMLSKYKATGKMPPAKVTDKRGRR